MDPTELRNLIERIRRNTHVPDIITLCDAADKMRLKLASQGVTKTPVNTVTPVTNSTPLSVTNHPPVTKKGRPPSGNALSPAEKQRRYRERKAKTPNS